MSDRTHGRHRAQARYNPVAELSSIVSDAASPMVKGSAVLAATGGLVAAVAIPANADEAPAAPADTGQEVAQSAPAAVAPAVSAPTDVTPSAGNTSFGALQVAAVEKPQGPPPWLVRRIAEARAERERQAAEERAAEERAAEQARESESSNTASRTQQRTTQQAPAPAAKPKTATDSPSTSGGAVGIAKQYTGVPYVYGGATPSGFDCSGFTMYVFNKLGKSLPRTAAAQQSAVTPVSSPQPGDLVFFGSPAWHVGIYVGNGQMIDAPRSGKSVSVRPIFDGVSGYGRV